MPFRSYLSITLALICVFSLLYLRTAGGQVFTTESQRRWNIETQHPLVSNWQLQDQQGRYFTLADLSKRGVLIDFIFTRCTTICRAAGSRYAQLQQQTSHWPEPPLLLSISIDPQHDIPEQLKRYQQRYSKQEDDWLVARPIDEQTLTRIKQDTGIKVIADGFGGYAHTDSFHWMREQHLLKVMDLDDNSILEQLK